MERINPLPHPKKNEKNEKFSATLTNTNFRQIEKWRNFHKNDQKTDDKELKNDKIYGFLLK